MRLIDADGILDAVCDWCEQSPCEGARHGTIQECMTIRNLRTVLNDIPTAYDVGKVLEELRACSFEVISEDCYVALDFDETIEIVKGGGSDD